MTSPDPEGEMGTTVQEAVVLILKVAGYAVAWFAALVFVGGVLIAANCVRVRP